MSWFLTRPHERLKFGGSIDADALFLLERWHADGFGHCLIDKIGYLVSRIGLSFCEKLLPYGAMTDSGLR